MARKYKSTYYYHIGSNWYYRWDAAGIKVKAQLSREEVTRRNRIVKSYKERIKAPPIVERKPFDQTVFNNDRPEKRVTIRIYILNEETDEWELLDKYSTSPRNYFKRFLYYFNMYYEFATAELMEYEQT